MKAYVRSQAGSYVPREFVELADLGAAAFIDVGAFGDVVGPASAADNALARFAGNTGKLMQNSAAILNDASVLSFGRVVVAVMTLALCAVQS